MIYFFCLILFFFISFNMFVFIFEIATLDFIKNEIIHASTSKGKLAFYEPTEMLKPLFDKAITVFIFTKNNNIHSRLICH